MFVDTLTVKFRCW